MRFTFISHRCRRALSLLLCVSLIAMGCSTTFVPNNPSPTCTVTTGGAPPFASWFQSGTVTKDGVVNPANSITFPDSPNCSFYQWSEQMYLWLTSPAPSSYGGGGRIFNSPAFYDVSPLDANGDRTLIPHVNGIFRDFSLRAAQVGAHDLQLVFAKGGRMLEIEPAPIGPAGGPLVLNAQNQRVEVSRIVLQDKGTPVFFDLRGTAIDGVKPLMRTEARRELVVQKFEAVRPGAAMQKGLALTVPIFLDSNGVLVDVEQGQAGGNGVLMAQNHSLVYYTTIVNDVYAYFMTAVKNGAIVATHFPTTQTELNAVTAFASSHGKTFPDPEALAIEAKLSWVEASTLSNPNDYLTTTANIPVYDMTTNPQNQWTQTGTKTAKLALVGVHVVGSTAGHPEMIWATFEHQSNMPNGDYTYIDANNTPVFVPKSTAGNWLFCSGGSTGPFNKEHMSVNPLQGTINANTADGFTISPSDTIRWKSWGGASDVSPNPIAIPGTPPSAGSNTEILSINNSVRNQLLSGDLRKNYVMTGATWTIGGAAPSGQFPGGNEVGTSMLANGTMETYQQGSDETQNGTGSNAIPGTNCFSCHLTNTVNKNKVLQVSHVFGPLKGLF